MPQQIDVAKLVSRPESDSSLVRFEDQTDQHAPRLNYSVPLPGAYTGKFYLEYQNDRLPWSQEALKVDSVTKEAAGTDNSGSLGDRLKSDRELRYRIGVFPGDPFDPYGPINPVAAHPATAQPALQPVGTVPAGITVVEGTDLRPTSIVVSGHEVPVDEIAAKAKKNKALVVYEAFGGKVKHTYVREATSAQDANPHFYIIERYRLSSYFQDYGAGRTVNTFTLFPGEKTNLYVRSWRRSEERFRSASSIFDSFTQECASDFEASLESENTYKSSYEKTKKWKASGGFGVNLGIVKVGGGGGGGGTSKSAREQMSKTVSNVSMHHASKASANRETSVSTEVETSEAREFEKITEREIKNVNLSRVLNLVCRELNQRLTTYLSLVDVTIAFANDGHTYEEVPLHDIDTLINKYVNNAWGGAVPAGADNNPRVEVKSQLINMIRFVHDFNGDRHEFIEEVDDGTGHGRYWRVKRRSNPEQRHPFYPGGEIPVEGIVLNIDRHTLRTDSIMFDALLGHGVALDNYALGTQQEVLYEKQLNNKKTELGMQLVADAQFEKVEAFKSLFVCCPHDDEAEDDE